MSGKKKKPNPLFDHPLNALMRGEAVWDDNFVAAMAEGRKPVCSFDWKKMTKPVDAENKENAAKPHVGDDVKVASYNEVIEKCCSKYKPLQIFDNATYHSDGEVKSFNLECQGTESSPCSCSSRSDIKTQRTPPGPSPHKPRAKKPKTKDGLVQAKGFNKKDFEGEEETPMKIPANACKWCLLYPCIVDAEETVEEGHMICDNLIAQGETEKRTFRFPLYQMYARALGYTGKRWILPRCVYLWVDRHFVDEGEERTGFKAK